jgi:hypothetical protein
MGRPADRGVAREQLLTMRLTQNESETLNSQRLERGFSTRSAYLRRLVYEDGQKLARKRSES